MTYAALYLPPEMLPEFTKRQDEALASMMAVASTRHLAHDSGDGADLNHCPFCGSGGIIGGADGTVTCQFCHRNFTVQVQPEFKNMPQTVDGQPFNIPGMPGEGPDAGDAAGLGQDQADEAQQSDLTDPESDRGESPFETKDDNPFAKKEDKPKGNNPFTSSRMVTANGTSLEVDAYLQHLALLYADDKPHVLAQVRAQNGAS